MQHLDAHLEWLRVRNLSEMTVAQRRYTILRLGRDLGVTPDDATSEDLYRWQTRQLRRSAAYRCASLTHIRGYYRWLVAAGIRRDDPSAALPTPKRARGVPRPISEDRLAAAILGAPPRIRPWLVLAAWSGLRAGEIAAMDRADVLDTATPPVLIVRGKGGRQRVVPLNGTALSALTAHGLPSRGYVFPRPDGSGTANSAARVSQVANGWLHEHGIPETLHQLRHRFATRAYQGSRDLRVVQELLGHRSPATTAIYAGYAAGAALEAVLRLDDEQGAA